MLINATLEVAPHDPGFQKAVATVLTGMEQFFHRSVAAGQAAGVITTTQSAKDLARHLLGVLIGVRVLARVRPEKALLEGVVRPALALLDRRESEQEKPQPKPRGAKGLSRAGPRKPARAP